METRPPSAWQYYFRTPDATVYGPVDMATLCLWAADARVIPGCELSADRNTWFPVEALPELRLNWSVHFDDGTTYGPLNLLAIWTLAAEKSIPRGVRLVEAGSPRTAVLDDSLHPLLVDECRKVLAGCGSTLTDTIVAMRDKLETATSTLTERDCQLSALSLKLTRTEADLAVNLKLVAETQRRLSETLETGRELARTDAESLARVKSELDTLSGSLQEARAALQAKEARVLEQDSTLAALKTELEGLSAQLKAKDSAQEKDRLGARQRDEAVAKQLSQAKEALAGAQKAGRQAEQKLKDDMASVQRDLNALMRASRCVKQVVMAEKVKPSSIDWVGEGKDTRAFPQKGDDDEVQFDRLTLNEKFVALQKELQSSAAEKEALRLDLENIRGRYGYLQTDSSRKEKESSEKLAQIQKEIKTSSELMARTMEELERRERQLRESRKAGGASPVDSAAAPVVLDAEVIHLEVLGPEEGAGHAAGEQGPVVGPLVPEAEPPRGEGMLNNVEAQLQRELKTWEASKRDKEHKGGTLGKWFRRR
jgi:hypothetical protein